MQRFHEPAPGGGAARNLPHRHMHANNMAIFQKPKKDQEKVPVESGPIYEDCKGLKQNVNTQILLKPE